MEIPRETADMLRRYFLNAAPFMWGVLEGRTKKERLQEIQELGFLQDCPKYNKITYEAINQRLLVELGIEGILDKIVVPKVYNRLGSEALQRFRRNWEQGQRPEKKYLKENKLYRYHRVIWREQWEENRPVPDKDPALIFLEINAKLDFIDRWTVFAGLWFEIIELLITKDEKENLIKSSS